MKNLFYLICALCLAVCVFDASAEDRYYSTNTTETFVVNGAFSDDVHFTVAKPGAFRGLVYPLNQTVACATRYCRSPGSFKVTLSYVAVDGVAVPFGPNAYWTLDLDAGEHVLTVVGTGAGTGLFTGAGKYNVSVFRTLVTPPTDD
jgi:hypothetical protein